MYLEFNDEVKRALLPPSIQSIDTVRALFLRSFSQLTSQYLSLPHVKIYIQEPSKGQLFYELDDLRFALLHLRVIRISEVPHFSQIPYLFSLNPVCSTPMTNHRCHSSEVSPPQ